MPTEDYVPIAIGSVILTALPSGNTKPVMAVAMRFIVPIRKAQASLAFLPLGIWNFI
jgi:hypothetical protein